MGKVELVHSRSGEVVVRRKFVRDGQGVKSFLDSGEGYVEVDS